MGDVDGIEELGWRFGFILPPLALLTHARHAGAGLPCLCALTYTESGASSSSISQVELQEIKAGSEYDLELLSLVQQHVRYTRSEVGQRLLADWPAARAQFKLVMPTEFQAVMVKRKAEAAEAVALAKEATQAIKAAEAAVAADEPDAFDRLKRLAEASAAETVRMTSVSPFVPSSW